MKKKFLITGGLGFIGSALVKHLIKNGQSVRVLDNKSRGFSRRLKDIEGKFEMVNGDIRNPEVVERSCQGINCIIHLAYVNGTEFFYSKPELVLEVGVKGIVNILDACIKNKVEEVFLSSSSEVYQTPSKIPTPENIPLTVPDPLNPRFSYGGGKIISELMTLNYGRKFFKRVVIFRPHNVYGPDMGWEHVIPQLILRIKKLAKQDNMNISLPIQGSGKETRAFIYIDDFAKGFEKILQKGKHLEIYNIGVMEEVTIKDLAIKIGKVFNKKVSVVPNRLRLGSTLRRCPDTLKLTKLGFKPNIGLADGLQKTAQWYNTFAHLQRRYD